MICTDQTSFKRLGQEGSGGWCACHRLERIDMHTVLVGNLKERRTWKMCK